MRVRILDKDIPVFSKPDGSSLPFARLKEGEETDLGSVVKASGFQWVEVTLADSRHGFIAGDAKIHKIEQTTVHQEKVDLFDQPSARSTTKARLVKGQRIYLLGVVKGDDGDWVRIRDLQGHEGFIRGDTRIGNEQKKDLNPAPTKLQNSPQRGRNRGAADVRNGFILIVIGLIITVGSRLLAPQLGGRYFISYGAVIVGCLWILRGLFRLVTKR